MTTWVLIIYFTWGDAGGMTSATFHSKEACMAAANFYTQSNGAFGAYFRPNCFEDKK